MRFVGLALMPCLSHLGLVSNMWKLHSSMCLIYVVYVMRLSTHVV